MVFDNAELTANGRSEEFDFGTYYEILERAPGFVKLKLPGGQIDYVRPAHVAVVPARQYIVTTEGFKKDDRPRLRFWESGVKLNEFLAGNNTSESQWDYEEYFDKAPNFQIKLPYIEADTLDLLGGNRQITICSVMLPISRDMLAAFQKARVGGDLMMDMYLLADNSGSTKDFLENAIGELGKLLVRNDAVRTRIHKLVVTTFGLGHMKKGVSRGAVQLGDLETIGDWHPVGENGPTEGDRSPLLDALADVNAALSPQKEIFPLFVVLSKADVDQSAYVGSLGKKVSIEDLRLKVDGRAEGIFAQVTPEPGNDLREASHKLVGLTHSSYIEYSEGLAEKIVSEMEASAKGGRDLVLEPKAFDAVGQAANAKHMIAFLPRVLSPSATLPPPQAYAAKADWYTVRVWVTLNDLALKEETVR
jgi:hypothetical protein